MLREMSPFWPCWIQSQAFCRHALHSWVRETNGKRSGHKNDGSRFPGVGLNETETQGASWAVSMG